MSSTCQTCGKPVRLLKDRSNKFCNPCYERSRRERVVKECEDAILKRQQEIAAYRKRIMEKYG